MVPLSSPLYSIHTHREKEKERGRERRWGDDLGDSTAQTAEMTFVRPSLLVQCDFPSANSARPKIRVRKAESAFTLNRDRCAHLGSKRMRSFVSPFHLYLNCTHAHSHRHSNEEWRPLSRQQSIWQAGLCGANFTDDFHHLSFFSGGLRSAGKFFSSLLASYFWPTNRFVVTRLSNLRIICWKWLTVTMAVGGVLRDSIVYCTGKIYRTLNHTTTMKTTDDYLSAVPYGLLNIRTR